jgi:glycosyltransferase involved in cell wall biosynthesis
MQPLVSILIPAFNAAPWIAETLRSAVQQSWPRTEIIVVDDGSIDSTVEIARRFERHGVRVVEQVNQGAAAARNHALSLCRGDYIQWLDADDLLSPDKIASQLAAVDLAREPRILLSSGWGYFAYRAHRARFQPSTLWQSQLPVEWLIHKLEGNLHMQTATWLCSRELAHAAGPWDTRLLSDDDGEYFTRAILASAGVRFVSEGRVYYRVSGAQRLSNIGWSDRKKDAQLLAMRLTVGHLRGFEDTSRTRHACLTYLQNWLMFFYPERPDLMSAAQQFADEIGGHLKLPKLHWKYVWLRPLFGWATAKRAQLVLPQLKSSLACTWDKAMYRLEESLHRRALLGS